jgi:2-polyprenyl-3-methyl-5-hydroxy-6-metoxy-1,4-benzoquinol methylase
VTHAMLTRAVSTCSAEMHRGERLRLPLVRDRPAWVERLCAQTSGEVAHLGCADSPYTDELLAAGELLHSRLVRVARVTGFDVDPRALEQVREALPGERFVLADVTDELPAEERGRYQLVIAGEVLEHVPNADAFLRGCAALLAPGGRLCVTVPNACCPKIGLRAVLGRESVHPDHRVYFGPRTLRRTLDGAGYEVTELASCFAPVTSAAGRLVVNPLLAVTHRIFQGPVGDGLIAVASARSNPSTIAS